MAPEHPDLHAPPSASAPGSDPDELTRIVDERQTDGEAHFKDVLDPQPEGGGSGKTAPDDEGADEDPDDEVREQSDPPG
jgi:hypothetical protein